MSILKYTTKVDAHKTISEINQILSKAGAIKITVDNDEERNPFAITFCIRFNGDMIAFYLPCNAQGVLKAMKADKNIPGSFKTQGQAFRVGWRIKKTWIEAQLAIVEADMADLAEVFLSYAVMKNGETLYQHLQSKGTQLLLGN